MASDEANKKKIAALTPAPAPITDTARLDWLERAIRAGQAYPWLNGDTGMWTVGRQEVGRDFREAIDFAMTSEER